MHVKFHVVSFIKGLPGTARSAPGSSVLYDLYKTDTHTPVSSPKQIIILPSMIYDMYPTLSSLISLIHQFYDLVYLNATRPTVDELLTTIIDWQGVGGLSEQDQRLAACGGGCERTCGEV